MSLSALLTAVTRSLTPRTFHFLSQPTQLFEPRLKRRAAPKFSHPPRGAWRIATGLGAPLLAAAISSGAWAEVHSTAQADMSVEVKGLPDTAAPGDAIKATVLCLNKGPASAKDATCEVPTGELPSGATVVCQPVPLPNPLPAKAAITCTVQFKAPAEGAIQVVARTKSSTPDPVKENNRAVDSVQLWESADMRATTTLPGTVVGGQPVTVRGVCRNAGPGTASAPSCVLSGLPSGATQSCVPSPLPYLFRLDAVVTCTSTFNAPNDGRLTITTTAGSRTPDAKPANNVDTKSIDIKGLADMVAVFSDVPVNPAPNSPIKATLTCTNKGPSPAAAPSCKLLNPPEGTRLSCVPKPAPDPLAVNEAITCEVSSTAPRAGDAITLTGMAGAKTPDAKLSNNTARATITTVTSTPLVDLKATTAAPASVSAGQQVTVQGVCLNLGPDAALVPSCVLSGLPSGAVQSCTPNPAPDPLAKNQSVTCRASFAAPADGSLNITTTAGSAMVESNPSNNVDSKRITVKPVADVAVGLSGFDAKPLASSKTTGTVTCRNQGPSVAADATCAVTGLPEGSSVSCTPASPVAGLAVGASMVCVVSYTAPASGKVDIVGTAGTSSSDPVLSNNEARLTATVAPPLQSDMRSKTTVPASAAPGQNVTAVGSCYNAGPGAAVSPTCVMSGLPSGPSGSSGITPVCAADPAAGKQGVTCQATFPAPASGTVEITTTAGSSSPDANPANDISRGTLSVTPPQADLQTTTSGFASTANAGDVIKGSVKCSNLGPDPAEAPQCQVSTLPTGATVSCTPNPLPARLAVGASVACQVSYTVPSDGAPLTVTGVASSKTADPVSTNNTAQATINTVPQADMQAKTTVPTSATAGQPVTVSGRCLNQGPSAAASPACVLSGLPAGAVQTCTPDLAANPLATGSALSCTATFTAPDAGPLSITTTASSLTADPAKANNTDTQPVTVKAAPPAPGADLQATFNGLPAQATAGAPVTGTLRCANAGPGAAENVTCAVTGLPAGGTAVCTPTAPVASLGSGVAITCAISYTTPKDGSAVDLTGTAASPTPDPNPANNQASSSTAITPVVLPKPADLQASLTGLGKVLPGAQVTGVATCTNLGTGTADAPQCDVTGLPADAVLSCTPTPLPAQLAVDESIRCNIQFKAPGDGKSTTVTVKASSNTPDPVAANNQATSTVTSQTPLADMQAQISGFNRATVVGAPVKGVAKCRNTGPESAADASCEITGVPDGATVVCTPSPVPNPLAVNARISCNVSFAAPGGTTPTTIDVRARTSTPDPVRSNDTARAVVPPPATGPLLTINAVDDPALVVGKTGGKTTVLGNDTLRDQPATPATVTVKRAGSLVILPTLTVDEQGVLTVPPNTPPGIYTITYQICDKDDPLLCDNANVQVVVQEGIGGRVWLDDNGSGAGNQRPDPDEPGLIGWVAELVYPPGHPKAGQVVTGLDGAPARGVTDNDGRYELPPVPAGNYEVRLRSPDEGSKPGPIYGLTVEAAPPGVQINPKTRAVVVNLPVGIVLAEVDLPVRQMGVVYDALTRAPLPGASLRLIGPNGLPVPAAQLLAGQQDQTVVSSGPAKGSYRFDLINTAPTGVYTLQITPPSGYTAPSTVLPPSGLLAQPVVSQFAVVPHGAPPKGSQATTYYLQLTLNPSANRARIVNNHLPLDPTSIPQLSLEKRVNVTEAEIGDVVRYTLRIHNLSPSAALSNVTVTDTLPTGFKFVPNTARLIAGATPTALPNPAGSPGPKLVFTLGNLAADQTVEINYHVRLGVGAAEGDGINRAQAQGLVGTSPLRSLIAQARVTVGGGVFRSEACLIGKIYMDCGNSVGQGNGNAIQDAGELGIPGVRFYLEDGTSITSDSEGKYSFCGLTPRTHVMKVDSTTLPRGARLGTTSNRHGGDPGSLFLDLKNGELHPADFRDMSCHPAVLKEVKKRRDLLKGGDVRVPEVGKPASRTGPGLGLERMKKSASEQGARP